MAGKIVMREAEMVAGEPIVDVFVVGQFRNTVIMFVGVVVLTVGFRAVGYEDLISQVLISVVLTVFVSLVFIDSTFVAITPTRALLLKGGRVLPFPAEVVRTLHRGDVWFVEDGYGRSMQIDGQSYNVGKGWNRLRSLIGDDADAATTPTDRID